MLVYDMSKEDPDIHDSMFYCECKEQEWEDWMLRTLELIKERKWSFLEEIAEHLNELEMIKRN